MRKKTTHDDEKQPWNQRDHPRQTILDDHPINQYRLKKKDDTSHNILS